MVLPFPACFRLLAMQRKDMDTQWGTATSRLIPGNRRVVMRVLKDARFGIIAVYEADHGVPGSKVLTFDSQQTTVRIPSFPRNWATLSVNALLGLVLIHSE